MGPGMAMREEPINLSRREWERLKARHELERASDVRTRRLPSQPTAADFMAQEMASKELSIHKPQHRTVTLRAPARCLGLRPRISNPHADPLTSSVNTFSWSGRKHYGLRRPKSA